MTKDQINAVLARVHAWSEEHQAYAAEVLLRIEAQGTVPIRLTDDEWAAIQEGNAQAERGEFVSDEDMAAFWNRHDRSRFSQKTNAAPKRAIRPKIRCLS